MRYLIFLAAMALIPLGALASNASDERNSAPVRAEGPMHLNPQQMDGISAGQRNIHIHPDSAASIPADGLSLPDAAGAAVDNTDASVLGDHP